MTFPNSLNKITPSKSKDSRVAIVMRTKNRPLLLARAFASVLAQKYQNWHLYVVNDGGHRDDVEKLITKNESVFKGRLTVIHHEMSQGMEAASNSALKRSEGEFLIVHDDDDSWHPEFLEKTVGFLNDPQNSAFAAVITGVEQINEKIVGENIVEMDRTEFKLLDSEIDFSTLLSRNLFQPISLLIRKSVVSSVGEFNHQLPVLGDWDFNIRVLMFGDIGTIPERLAYYHVRRSEEESIYVNSVVAEVGSHHKYNVLYRNSNLRSALNTNPEMLGVVQALGWQIKEIASKLNREFEPLQAQVLNLNDQIDLLHARFLRLEEGMADTQYLLRKILAPARWVRNIFRSFRKMFAKFSKKP